MCQQQTVAVTVYFGPEADRHNFEQILSVLLIPPKWKYLYMYLVAKFLL